MTLHMLYPWHTAKIKKLYCCMALWIISYHLNISELYLYIQISKEELVMALIIWHAIIIVVIL